MPSGELGCESISTLECVWEGLLIRFLIFHPLDNPGMCVCVRPRVRAPPCVCAPVCVRVCKEIYLVCVCVCVSV
jgi:hypothetical protein